MTQKLVLSCFLQLVLSLFHNVFSLLSFKGKWTVLYSTTHSHSDGCIRKQLGVSILPNNIWQTGAAGDRTFNLQISHLYVKSHSEALR